MYKKITPSEKITRNVNKNQNILNITIKETDIDETIKVHKNVKEFNDGLSLSKEYFENRYKDSEKLIIVAYYKQHPIGYIIGYDKFRDNKTSFYCWMAGVDNNYRRLGALNKLMDYQMEWARKNGYKKLRIKTRNSRREMLSFLVKKGFNFLSIEEKENIIDNRINLEIQL